MSLDGKDLLGNKCHYVSCMGTKYSCKFTAAVQIDTIMAVEMSGSIIMTLIYWSRRFMIKKTG